ncbi:hypothetical protein FM036_44470, partial [Nostoc sp. HG1]|nr:hypothetical protein [Nostoc sp. HG1]
MIRKVWKGFCHSNRHKSAFCVEGSKAGVSFFLRRECVSIGPQTADAFSKAAFTRSLQKLIPEVQAEDLVPTHAGVRAQALMN